MTSREVAELEPGRARPDVEARVGTDEFRGSEGSAPVTHACPLTTEVSVASTATGRRPRPPGNVNSTDSEPGRRRRPESPTPSPRSDAGCGWSGCRSTRSRASRGRPQDPTYSRWPGRTTSLPGTEPRTDAAGIGWCRLRRGRGDAGRGACSAPSSGSGPKRARSRCAVRTVSPVRPRACRRRAC